MFLECYRVIKELVQIREATAAADARIAAEGFDPSTWPECTQQSKLTPSLLVLSQWPDAQGGRAQDSYGCQAQVGAHAAASATIVAAEASSRHIGQQSHRARLSTRRGTMAADDEEDGVKRPLLDNDVSLV